MLFHFVERKWWYFVAEIRMGFIGLSHTSSAKLASKGASWKANKFSAKDFIEVRRGELFEFARDRRMQPSISKNIARSRRPRVDPLTVLHDGLYLCIVWLAAEFRDLWNLYADEDGAAALLIEQPFLGCP